MSERSLATVPRHDIQLSAPTSIALAFDSEKMGLIKRQICNGASDDELQLFLHQCQRTGLDPLTRQIYAVFRNAKEGFGPNAKWTKKMSIQVSIDGFRLIAERSGSYEGQTPALWCGSDGKWTDAWLSNSEPAAAKVGVYRRGFREPVYAVARFDSYKQATNDGKLSGLWAKMCSRAGFGSFRTASTGRSRISAAAWWANAYGTWIASARWWASAMTARGVIMTFAGNTAPLVR